MQRLVALLLMLSLAPVVPAECIDSPRIRLIGSGITLKQLTNNDARLRKEAKSKQIPYLGQYDLAELTTHYQAGDLYYSYEDIGPGNKPISGGTALVKGSCIVLLFPEWIA